MATPSLHVVMFPWFAMGHIIPFLQLSNKLAKKGHKISFLIPTKTLPKVQNLNLHTDLITFVPLVVPHFEGLPIGAETMTDVPISMSPLLGTAFDLMEHHVETTLQSIEPDFVFFDFAYWIPNIGQRLGFKSIFYSVISAATCSYRASLFKPIKDHQFTEFDLIKPSPGYPHSSSMQLQVHVARPASFLLRKFGKSGLMFYERMTISISESDAISFRTCRETEGPYCDYIESQWSKKILLTGPVLPDPPNFVLEERWHKWLGGFKKSSVIYCAFGSECVLEKDQFQELVMGLEQTGFPFLVVLKPPFGTETVESALPDGFEERVKGRGLVHGGWVQQQLILNHPSIGCFVSHCGFGSMWESLMNDCQIVLIPHVPDQYINTNLMSQVLKVDVAVERREEDRWFSRVNVCKAVQLVMNEGSELGNEVKRNHAKLKSIVLSEGFESSYMDDFNQNLYYLLQ